MNARVHNPNSHTHTHTTHAVRSHGDAEWIKMFFSLRSHTSPSTIELVSLFSTMQWNLTLSFLLNGFFSSDFFRSTTFRMICSAFLFFFFQFLFFLFRSINTYRYAKLTQLKDLIVMNFTMLRWVVNHSFGSIWSIAISFDERNWLKFLRFNIFLWQISLES